MVIACDFIGCLILLASLSSVSGLCSTCLDERCHDNGECIIGCVPGFVGEYCNEACPPRCLNNRCHLDIDDGTVICTEGCELGYCHIQCDLPCPGECVTCDRQCGSCNVTLCNNRYFGADCGQICSPRYEKCDRETGQCIICRRGYFGDECNQECTSCFTRADTIRDTCLSGCDICQSFETCPVSYYGNNCEIPCSPGCDNPEHECNRATGECSDGCVPGYHGLTCSYTCSEHCLSGRCNRATGECSAGCVSGYQGTTCNYTCGEHCLSGRCNRATGECSDGCVSRYHGLTCNNTCNSFCVGRVCNQHNGVCTSGCISGYHTNLDLCEKYDNEGSHTAVAIAVPISLVCLFAGMVTAAVIWRRRRSRRPNRSQTEYGEKGTNGADVVEPLLKYKKEDAPQQLPEEVQHLKKAPQQLPEEIEHLKTRTREEIDSATAGMIRVSAVEDVLDKLKAGQRWVTITGNAGDGKTTLGYLVLKEFLQKNVNVFTVYKPEEYDQIEKMKEDRVIMFDDRFGAFLADQQLIKSWLDVIRKLLSFNENDQQDNHVIFISRRNVVNESKMYLGQYTDKMFDPKCVVDLSVRKVKEERLKILDYHLQHENVTVNPELKDNVSNKDIAHGFPHCCKMYSKLRSNGFVVDIEEFFESPLKFLDMTTKVLYKDNCKDLFQLMIKNDGNFDVYTVEDEHKREKLLQVEKEQEGSYITVWMNGVCQFAHPSVYESVLNVINEIDPLYCVQYATLSVIRQKMIILTSDEEDRRRYLCYISVKPIPAVLKALAERFSKEILMGDYSVFEHRLCRSGEFCEALVSCCVTTDEKENGSKQFINHLGVDGETMLCKAVRSRSKAAVQRLVKAAADVDKQGTIGRTPLHHLCQLRISTNAYAKDDDDDYAEDDDDDKRYPVDLDTLRLIIDAGKGDVNIGDQYGQTPLHFLCQVRNSAAADGHCDDKLHDVVINAMRLIIIEGKGDVNIGDQYGQTPLHYLCQVEKSAVADEHYDDKLQRFVMGAIRLIMTEGSGDINISDNYGQSPLHYLFKCCALSTEEILWITTQGKGDINKCEQHKSTPLHYLCGNSGLQLDTVDLLIKEGKGVFNKGDEHGTTPFHYLCKNDKIESDLVLQIVNTANGDINKQDNNGITPLHVLCKGSLPIENMLTLINQGDKADIYGNTPLHYLCRRRGINVEVLQQQLEQFPETDMKKQNDLGYTPLDYLTDKDSTFPWTDGMINRSAADLVVCRWKDGDNWIVVLGRAMILNSERVHWELQVEDFGRVLTNMARSGQRSSPSQFSEFTGTCSSPIPVPPSPSPLTTPSSYWETSSTLTRKRRDGILFLEMGFVQGKSDMDNWECVSGFPNSVCVSVRDECDVHPDRLCIQVWRRDQEGRLGHQVGECVSLSLPTLGVVFTLTFGLVLDVGRGRVGFIDVERGELLCKVDLQMEEWVFPMFFVDLFNDDCPTRMKLVSGREICITDKKIQLIQQALSG